ncbi:MAG: hypothetical protein RMK57_13865 [Bryobacterales bacterium]|nr:hypothetical protein [Bryobacteraceae bacterium]MDW8355607.1 hypothetical protein [Bryobacterales bacterium]
MNATEISSTAVLYHLEDGVEESLTAALVRLGVTVYRMGARHSPAQCVALAQQIDAEVIFCGDDRMQYRTLVEAAATHGSPAAVVVISRLPDTNDWLDALEAGVFDYCAAPFEAAQLRWLLESARLRRRGAPSLTSQAA